MKYNKTFHLLTRSALLLSAFSIGGILSGNLGTDCFPQTFVHAATGPKIWGVHPQLVSDGQQLNLLHGIEGRDEDGSDISQLIKVSHHIKWDQEGTYDVTYTLTNPQGHTTTARTTVTVKLPAWRKQLDDLQNQADTVEKNLNDLKDQLPNTIINEIQPKINDINTQLKALREKDRLFASDLGELRARITRAEKDIDGLKDKDKELEAKIGDLKLNLGKLGQKVDDLQDQVNKHEKRLDDLEPRVFRLETNLALTIERVAGLEERTKWLEDDLRLLEGQFDDQAKQLQAQINANKQLIAELKAEIAGIKEKIAQHDKDIDGLFKHIDELNKRINTLENAMNKHGQMINDLIERMDNAEVALTHAKERIATLEAQNKQLAEKANALSDQMADTKKALLQSIQENTNEINGLKEKAAEIAAKLADHDKDIDQIKAEIKSLYSGLQKVGSAVIAHDQQIATLSLRLTRIEDHLKTTETGLSVLDKFLKELEDKVNQSDQAKDTFLREFQDKIGDMREAGGAIQAKMKSLTQRLAERGADFDQIDKDTAELEKQAVDLVDRAKAQSDKADALGKMSATLQQALEEANQKISDLQKIQDALEGKVKALEDQHTQEVQTLGQVVQSNRQSLDQMKSQIDHLNQQFPDLLKDQAGLQNTLSQLNQASDTMKTNLSQLSEKEAPLLKKIGGLEQTGTEVEKLANEMKEKVADLKNVQNSVEKANKKVGDTNHDTKEKNQSTQKNEKKSGEKKEGKDKSLDRSNEGKGKSLPKTGLRNPIYLLLSGLAVVASAVVLWVSGVFKKVNSPLNKK